MINIGGTFREHSLAQFSSRFLFNYCFHCQHGKHVKHTCITRKKTAQAVHLSKINDALCISNDSRRAKVLPMHFYQRDFPTRSRKLKALFESIPRQCCGVNHTSAYVNGALSLKDLYTLEHIASPWNDGID